ncbi:hypothetical protein ACFQJ7_13135 [Halovenus rubra]|uniref:Uncharacterized protein n=2 Tax=Halovenus rubra TaxID=869890 RepID=A0ACC7DZD7_9EURY|nr:hypothetical protein [Halovenus rubra]
MSGQSQGDTERSVARGELVETVSDVDEQVECSEPQSDPDPHYQHEPLV